MSKKSKKEFKIKDCKDDEIFNPDTGRCVKKTGPIGKKLLEKQKQNDEFAQIFRPTLKNVIVPVKTDIKPYILYDIDSLRKELKNHIHENENGDEIKCIDDTCEVYTNFDRISKIAIPIHMHEDDKGNKYKCLNEACEIYERDYLSKIAKEPDYDTMKIQLKYFADRFSLVKDKIKIIDYNDIVDKIVAKYKDPEILKYIILLYLGQYSLSFIEFYNKFLNNTEEFVNMMKFRKDLADLYKNFENQDYNDIKNSISELKESNPVYAEKLNIVLEKLINKKILVKFIKAFLKQTEETFNDFYDNFIKDIRIKIKPEVDEEVTEIPLENIEIIDESKKPRKHILSTEELQNKIFMYSILPWLPTNIKSIYISEVDTNINKYIIKILPPINIDGKDWYKVNKKYYELQSDPNYTKIQNGDVLNFINLDGQIEVNFRIAYEPKEKKEDFIFQNEQIYTKEIQYLEKRNKTVETKLQDILKEPISFDTIKIGTQILKDFLKDKVNDEYIKKIIDSLSKSTSNINEFATKLGELAIYLNPVLNNITYGIFKNKLEMGYYKPEDLLSLSKEDKLPEIFGKDGVLDQQQNAEKYFKNSLSDFVFDFIESIFMYRNVHTKYKPKNKLLNNTVNFSLPNWIDECNKNIIIKIRSVLKFIKDNVYDIKRIYEILTEYKDIKNPIYSALILQILNTKDRITVIKIIDDFLKINIDPTITNDVKINDYGYYITYIENDIPYCLKIFDVLDRIEKKDLKNPFTGNVFSKDFLNKIEVYKEFRKKDIYKDFDIQNKVESKKNSLTPGLLNFIRMDINRMRDIQTTPIKMIFNPDNNTIHYEILNLSPTTNFTEIIRAYKKRMSDIKKIKKDLESELKVIKNFNVINEKFRRQIQELEEDSKKLKLKSAIKEIKNKIVEKKSFIKKTKQEDEDNIQKTLDLLEKETNDITNSYNFLSKELLKNDSGNSIIPEEENEEENEEDDNLFLENSLDGCNLSIQDGSIKTENIEDGDNINTDDVDIEDDVNTDDFDMEDEVNKDDVDKLDMEDEINIDDLDMEDGVDADGKESIISYTSDDSGNSVLSKYSDYQNLIDDSKYNFGEHKMFCKHCFETIKNKNDCVKSVLWNGIGTDIVLFCDTHCVDNFNWKKFKCKKHKRKSPKKSKKIM